jgi:hypothetical protein
MINIVLCILPRKVRRYLVFLDVKYKKYIKLGRRFYTEKPPNLNFRAGAFEYLEYY